MAAASERTGSTIDPAEVARFDAIARDWWDPKGPMAVLHKFNPVRLAYVRDLACEHYGRDPKSLRALDGLDLEARHGEVHGFLGPNGAGKTVTIRVLLGLLRADGGTATLLGGDPWTEVESLHRRLAYVPGDVTIWPSLTGGEGLLFQRILFDGHRGAPVVVGLARRFSLAWGRSRPERCDG